MTGFLDHESQGFVSAGIISLPYLLSNAALQSSSMSRMNNVIKAHLCVHDYSLPGKLLGEILYWLIDLQVLVSCWKQKSGQRHLDGQWLTLELCACSSQQMRSIWRGLLQLFASVYLQECIG